MDSKTKAQFDELGAKLREREARMQQVTTALEQVERTLAPLRVRVETNQAPFDRSPSPAIDYKSRYSIPTNSDKELSMALGWGPLEGDSGKYVLYRLHHSSSAYGSHQRHALLEQPFAVRAFAYDVLLPDFITRASKALEEQTKREAEQNAAYIEWAKDRRETIERDRAARIAKAKEEERKAEEKRERARKAREARFQKNPNSNSFAAQAQRAYDHLSTHLDAAKKPSLSVVPTPVIHDEPDLVREGNADAVIARKQEAEGEK